MRRAIGAWLFLTWLGVALVGCGSGNDSLVTPERLEAGGRIWELSAGDLPSAFDVFTNRRLFLGSGDINGNVGDFLLGGPPGSTELRLRSVSGLVRLEPSHAVGFQDLGMVDFEGLSEVPDGGYTDAEDTTGVEVVPGHVYALDILRTSTTENFAKLVVDAVGATDGDPNRQFIDFRVITQNQPGNHSFEER